LLRKIRSQNQKKDEPVLPIVEVILAPADVSKEKVIEETKKSEEEKAKEKEKEDK